MSSKKSCVPIDPSEITPRHLYYSRREFLKTAGVVSGAAMLVACTITSSSTPTAGATATQAPTPEGLKVSTNHDELGDPLNTFTQITNYNNYYEFTVDKLSVAKLAKNFKTSPWEVEVGGLVKNPKSYSVDDLIQQFPPKERIYRLRCVEAWSMVIPWLGFPLAKLLDEVQPTADAKFVRFVGVLDTADMPPVRRTNSWIGHIRKGCVWMKPCTT
jgi:sulfoxide reductase catalytic subunit YedY